MIFMTFQRAVFTHLRRRKKFNKRKASKLLWEILNEEKIFELTKKTTQIELFIAYMYL